MNLKRGKRTRDEASEEPAKKREPKKQKRKFGFWLPLLFYSAVILGMRDIEKKLAALQAEVSKDAAALEEARARFQVEKDKAFKLGEEWKETKKAQAVIPMITALHHGINENGEPMSQEGVGEVEDIGEDNLDFLDGGSKFLT